MTLSHIVVTDAWLQGGNGVFVTSIDLKCCCQYPESLVQNAESWVIK